MITGTWAGEYVYGESYEPGTSGMAVPFLLSLKAGWFRRFSGHVRDDVSRGGMPELGLVRGKFDQPRIFFTKVMPVAYTQDEETGGLIETREWLFRSFGVVGAPKGPHHILYRGELDGTGEAMSGKWIIPSESWDDPYGEGTWSARRIAPTPRPI